MIRFKDVCTSDKDLIQSYTLYSDRQNCDLGFANIISWRFLYNTQFAVVDGFLVFRFYADRHLAYMAPVYRGEWREELREGFTNVLRLMREDSIAMGHPFLMLGVGNLMADIIEDVMPDTFDMKPDRNYSDYIYTREKLVSLSGKKLQSKRNHINKFKKLYPNYEYRELTTDLIPECLRLEQQWRSGQEGADDTTEELRSMTRAFNRWEKLGLKGGTIFVDGKLMAFTFGCPINQNTFDVCVEKADTQYEGGFTIINQEFVSHLPEQYYYINREEDMGKEGLRFAKLSYKPDILLDKNVVMEKRPLADFEDQERIKQETRALWKQAFNDPEAFMELYFSRVYRNEYNVTCQIGRHVVGALQTLPYTLLYRGQEVRTAYMSGVSVDTGYRKQDVGNNLMRQAHFRLYFRNVVFATLIPAEKWLYGWYSKCGYAERIVCTPPPADAATVGFADFDRRQREKECVLLHDADGLEIIQEDIRLAGQDYHPATTNIQGMVRVINVLQALQLYAALNPAQQCKIRVQGDKDIPMNNAYYVIENGHVTKTDEPDAEACKMNIRQLADFIFKDVRAEMSLMLN